MARRRWPQVVAQTRRALRLFPAAAEFYVHAATAHDMLGQPAEARDVWQKAPRALRSSGFFHLNVAQFEAQLGNIDSAQDHLVSALQIDPSLRALAGHDPKLAALVAKLGLN
jgi:tetratricopeptide (TPR) repeat protein